MGKDCNFIIQTQLLQVTRFFANGAPNREMIYKYKFDRKGNWIKNEVLIRENIETNKMVPIYTHTQEKLNTINQTCPK